MTKHVTLFSLKFVTFLFGLAFSVLGTNLANAEGIPSPAENAEFRDQAVKHAQEALAAGKQGDAEGMVTHIRASRAVAKEINSEINGSKIQRASGHLMKSWARAKKDDIDAASEHAEGAIKEFGTMSF